MHRGKFVSWAVEILAAGAMAVGAEELRIEAFDASGTMAVQGLTNATAYRVEAADMPDGTWQNVAELPAAGGDSVTTSVAMAEAAGIFRVVASMTPALMTPVPAGAFTMGSPTNEPGYWPDEVLHAVTLTRDFTLQRTETTNQQMADVLNWAREQGLVTVTATSVVNAAGAPRELLDLDYQYIQIAWDGNTLAPDPGLEDYPCVGVTWFGAQAYCNYRSTQEGLTPAVNLNDWSFSIETDGYRLPTEAEWEYACRAGTTTAFYTGEITEVGWEPLDPNLDPAGWYWGNSINPDNPTTSGKGSHPVGTKQPNPWGLHDMHGNVWEWTADWYGNYEASSTNPIGPATGQFRTGRGGSWYSVAQACRSGNRYDIIATSAWADLGFRPARTATTP